MTNFQALAKFSFDIFLALIGLLIFFPIIIFAWSFAAIETKSNGFFFQTRVGRNGKLFSVVKIKTMKKIDGITTTSTSLNDPRITNSGFIFRKSKIDELPQLFNILLGQMSFVGPRPDVPGYADKLLFGDRVILSLRPGITGPAQLAYKNEETLLAKQENPIRYNDQIIWPNKVELNRKYVENYSFFNDIYYIWATVLGRNDK